ncbi:MAG TPA: tRNA lysidine(34) synthetase TilS, partial [Rhodopila sp.]|nr:tRNA lysidine(34) synthetase TilS [Rhodopila sp.]
MARLGPFEPRPALAVAVSGGADSTALALLTQDWVVQRNGAILGLVVDHGLRPESASEASITIDRLAAAGIPGRLLRLHGLARGPALAERARAARYDILTQACRDAGILHLLLGHHAADQAETLAMRVLRDSGSLGLAGMAALRETTWVRLLRPLLTIPPSALRAFLRERGIGWIEDPSNQDQRTLRARLRRQMAPATPDLTRALERAGWRRAADEAAVADILAERATLRPEGFALLTPGRITVGALSALLRTISGAGYPIAPHQLGDLAADPRPATVGGTRIMPASRLGPGLLVVREERAI